jgi:ribonuclease-3
MRQFRYKFNDNALFERALIQSGANAGYNNERMEFLGDRVLGLAIASMLYEMFPNETEGELARRHAALVSAKTLAEVAGEFGFDKRIRHGHMTGGKMDHIAADAMESVIAAIYLDGGYGAASKFVISEWAKLAERDAVAPKDPKTKLQELAQHSGTKELPVYELADVGKNMFRMRVTALGQTATGQGGTKKLASLAAAENLLKILKN